MHDLDDGNGHFDREIGKVSPTANDLPLVHSTDTYTLRTLVVDNLIRPQPCDVFKPELLTYFFYGRPSYHPNDDAEPTTQKHYLPICLILKPDAAVKIKRIFPFDSGAFHRAFYKAFMHKKMKLGDFGLAPHPSSAGKVVRYFFGSSANYLSGRADQTLELDESDFETSAYLDLLTSKGSNAFDSRNATIEIQTSDDLVFSEVVEAVVVPSSFVKTKVGKLLTAAGIETLVYRTIDRLRPDHFSSSIHDQCYNYYVSKKLISEDDL